MNRTFDQSTCKQGTCTVSKDHCGTYWCVITVDEEITNPMKQEIIRFDHWGQKVYSCLKLNHFVIFAPS